MSSHKNTEATAAITRTALDVDSAPAPFVLASNGPYWLVGRPGHPEPGALTALVKLGFAALVVFAYRKRHIR